VTSIERVTIRPARCVSRTVVAVLTLAALAAAPCPLNAQGLAGQISGTVVDSGGGVVPGASVTIRNAGTSLTRHTTTGMEGTFVIPDLLAGTYDVTVALEGFKTAEHNGIRLASTDRVTLRAIVLEVGGLKDMVTFTSAAPLVQTSNAARGACSFASSSTTRSIPISGRRSIRTQCPTTRPDR
jgi:Carboxypeptidase regulatory-like domain